MTEQELRARLAAFRAPGESQGEERALTIARAAVADVPARRPLRLPGIRTPRRLLVPVVLLALGAAGATAAVTLRDERTRPFAELRLPASGTLLISTANGSWAIERSHLRLLGAYRGGSLSPRALNAAFPHGRSLVLVRVASGRRVATVRAPSSVTLPRWSLERGGDVRIAYRAGTALYLVGGDGAGPGGAAKPALLARNTLAVAPAWRPAAAHRTLAFLSAGSLKVVEADGARSAGTLSLRWRGTARSLAWSRTGDRLQLSTDAETLVLAVDPAGRPRLLSRSRATPLAGVPSPDGRQRAVARGGLDAIAVTGPGTDRRLLRDLRANLGIRRTAPLDLTVDDWKG